MYNSKAVLCVFLKYFGFNSYKNILRNYASLVALTCVKYFD